MSPRSNLTDCESAELACTYAAQALAPNEVAAAEAHISLCPDCQREVESLRPVVNQFVSWPTDSVAIFRKNSGFSEGIRRYIPVA